MTSGPLVNEGSSLTAFTVTVKEWVIEVSSSPGLPTPPSSLIWTSMSAEPLASAPGVNTSSPLFVTSGGELNNPGLLFEMTTKLSTLCDESSSGGPMSIPVAHAGSLKLPESSHTVTSPPSVNDGSSLMGSMVMVKLWVGLWLSLGGGAAAPESVT